MLDVQEKSCCNYWYNKKARMRKLFLILFFLLLPNVVSAACDDPLKDGVDYTNCRFSYGPDLQGRYFPKSDLTIANLTRVNFTGATLIEANFKNTNLMEANFTSSNIINANFEGANLIGATWINGETCGPDSIGVCNK